MSFSFTIYYSYFMRYKITNSNFDNISFSIDKMVNPLNLFCNIVNLKNNFINFNLKLKFLHTQL